MPKAYKKAKKSMIQEVTALNLAKFKNRLSEKTQGSYSKRKSITPNLLEEPLASYVTRIRAVGNSKGVILNNTLIESAGFNQDIDIVIEAREGVIVLMQPNETGVNSDLSTWDVQFKRAIKKGAKPEKDLYEGMKNDFDTKEW